MKKPKRDLREWALVQCRSCDEGFWIYSIWSDPPEFCHTCELDRG